MKNISTKAILLFSFLFFSYNSFGQCANDANIYTFVYGGHSYEVVKENKTWTDAANCAIERNGYLAEINDSLEQNAIFDELSNKAGILHTNTQNQFGTGSVWLGGSDAGIEGNWIWDGNNNGTGSQFWSGGPGGTAIGGLYTNWGISPPEPDNSGGQDHLTIIIKPTAVNFGLWNDLVSTNTIYYLIEHNQPISTNDIELKSKLSIYPNPFENFISIENNNTESIANISIINLTGQLVKSFEAKQTPSQRIDVSEVNKGFYILKVKFKNGTSISYKLSK